jgi:hypothetical protein
MALEVGKLQAPHLQDLFCLVQHELSGDSSAGNMMLFDLSQNLLLAKQLSLSVADSALGLHQRMLKGAVLIGHSAVFLPW